jgi:hypothetical protein
MKILTIVGAVDHNDDGKCIFFAPFRNACFTPDSDLQRGVLLVKLAPCVFQFMSLESTKFQLDFIRCHHSNIPASQQTKLSIMSLLALLNAAWCCACCLFCWAALCPDINNPYDTKLMAYWSMRTLTWRTVFRRLVCAAGLCGQSESLLCAVARWESNLGP